MKCYNSSQLSVLTVLVREFVVCDNWFSSIPGPTWPNRYFVHAASSAGLDHSPSTEDIVRWFAQGVPLQNDTIFDKLNEGSKKWHGAVTLSKKNARILRLEYFQATATAARHTFIADARKARWVLAEMRWRWTLKVLWAAA